MLPDAPPSHHADHPGMVWITGGVFRMGSDQHYPEEGPVRRVRVDGFWMDRSPVTNAQFRAFVEATGYTTVAEAVFDAKDYPGLAPEALHAGSLVFTKPISSTGSAATATVEKWWHYCSGAQWRHPEGVGSGLLGLDDHPVVHVAWRDVQAYAAWAGKELPTEAEWEFACRGGLDGAEFAWGDAFKPQGLHLANTWQGDFPRENLCTDGFDRTSPVGSYPANAYGLVDMIGNVWEWTADWYASRHPPGGCCAASNPRGGPEEASFDAADRQLHVPRKVIKGGSHLCAPNYCQRYRPAARHALPVDTSACHVGFRCVRRTDPTRCFP